MRIFNFIFGAMLFAAAIYLSYWHTYDLLERGSYLSHSAHVGTFLGEGIFALGTVNIFHSKIKQIEMRWYSAPRIALYAGVGIVGYSNISSGFGKGAEAIGIGVAIPILMLIAEAVVSHSLSYNSLKNDKIKESANSELTNLIGKFSTLFEKKKRQVNPQILKNEQPQKNHLLLQENKSKKGSDPLKIAQDLKKELGRYPKIRELQEMGVSEWIARKTINRLKGRVG
jgi:hypothetical protein